jgi:hypothetical protein
MNASSVMNGEKCRSCKTKSTPRITASAATEINIDVRRAAAGLETPFVEIVDT